MYVAQLIHQYTVKIIYIYYTIQQSDGNPPLNLSFQSWIIFLEYNSHCVVIVERCISRASGICGKFCCFVSVALLFLLVPLFVGWNVASRIGSPAKKTVVYKLCLCSCVRISLVSVRLDIRWLLPVVGPCVYAYIRLCSVLVHYSQACSNLNYKLNYLTLVQTTTARTFLYQPLRRPLKTRLLKFSRLFGFSTIGSLVLSARPLVSSRNSRARDYCIGSSESRANGNVTSASKAISRGFAAASEIFSPPSVSLSPPATAARQVFGARTEFSVTRPHCGFFRRLQFVTSAKTRM